MTTTKKITMKINEQDIETILDSLLGAGTEEADELHDRLMISVIAAFGEEEDE